MRKQNYPGTLMFYRAFGPFEWDCTHKVLNFVYCTDQGEWNSVTLWGWWR